MFLWRLLLLFFLFQDFSIFNFKFLKITGKFIFLHWTHGRGLCQLYSRFLLSHKHSFSIMSSFLSAPLHTISNFIHTVTFSDKLFFLLIALLDLIIDILVRYYNDGYECVHQNKIHENNKYSEHYECIGGIIRNKIIKFYYILNKVHEQGVESLVKGGENIYL